MACLCAPTTHQGSFRCRLHRAPPLVINSATNQKGGFASNNEILSVRECESLSTAHQDLHPSSSPLSSPPRRSLASPSSSSPPRRSLASPSLSSPPPSPSSSSSSSSPSWSHSSSSAPSSFRYARPPPGKRSSAPRCSYPASSTSSSSASVPTTSPSARHAAAVAIMKQHLHTSKHMKSHMNRSNNTPLRSSSVYKIGPSRLSRMGRACADEVPILKKVDPTLPLKSSAFTSADLQARGLTTMETAKINLKMPWVVAKLKQNESSCKIVGCKAGPLIVPIVY